MGKFKEIDLDKDNYVFYKKSTMYFIIVLLIIHFICCAINNVERDNLKERNALIEQDRTELITENKQLQEVNKQLEEENRALKSVVENYRIPNNLDTREGNNDENI